MTKAERLEAEIKRTELMKEFDREYKIYGTICGIDEAGRGPLCGPVVAAAVILPDEYNILYINDSKKLSETKREEVYKEIDKYAVAYGVGIVSPERIDEINILQATYEAMRTAIHKLSVTPDILLNDAVTIPMVDIKQVPIIKGDAKSQSIAAASIVAKVTRDHLMEEYDKLYQKDIAELRVLCKEKNREIKDDMEKEEIIETLLAPIIIDLANNIDYIKELEDNLKDRVKEVRKQNNSKTKKRVIHLSTTDFNISMINQNLYEILKYVSDRLSMTWMEKYNLAQAYFEHYGNLEIPRGFKTINGYDYDENGIALGRWVDRQRQAYKGQGTNKITPDQIKLLEKIGMRFENIDTMETWMEKYNLAKAYFEHYGNLEIPTIFKTTNGYDYDENGIALGTWIATQRNAYKGMGKCKITQAQIKLLEEIGIKWFSNTSDDKLQKELITEDNLKKKQTEIMNRFTSYLNHIDDQEIDKDTINQGFVYELNRKHTR